ncbi:hypothetical protein OK074_5012 [Actinobacteria bacterium OK074]|nr:hypothetical protein OK074_5012 [Actinobacteria bacterium OK074]
MRAALSDFAAAVADRLPGSWSCAYHPHREDADQPQPGDRLWTPGPVLRSMPDWATRRHAVLTRADGPRLYIAERPWHRPEFVVAALQPDHLGYRSHHDAGVDGPRGITVGTDPARAASDIGRRLLPRYTGATRQLTRWARRYLMFDLTPDAAARMHIAFTWQDDGDLHARPDHLVAASLLRGYGFAYDRDAGAFRLPGILTVSLKTQAIHLTMTELGRRGIGVGVSHASAPAEPAPKPVSERVASLHDLNARAGQAGTLQEVVLLFAEAADKETGPLPAVEAFIATLGARAVALAPAPVRGEFTAALDALATRAGELRRDLAQIGLGLGEIELITQARGPQIWEHLFTPGGPTAGSGPSAAPPGTAPRR